MDAQERVASFIQQHQMTGTEQQFFRNDLAEIIRSIEAADALRLMKTEKLLAKYLDEDREARKLAQK